MPGDELRRAAITVGIIGEIFGIAPREGTMIGELVTTIYLERPDTSIRDAVDEIAESHPQLLCRPPR